MLISEQRKVPYFSFSQKHIQERYKWLDNIRELQNVLEGAMITTRHGTVSFQYLLEQDGQPVSQTKETNVIVENGTPDILTLDDLKQLKT